ncbi:hypothetical protein G6Z34_13035 [Clostridium perfringens]|uniref:Uncharacterized protein n=1 Tax=Clostridium perfringens TaxID=1502 RepID=A0AAP6WRS9_CLOPF|nr:hypothetical protein [Clostridium perfringens]NGU31009.1 hypothetical protein [Clostridium perfringens]
MDNFFKDYLNVSRAISLEDYNNNKDRLVISIVTNILITYVDEDYRDVINPIRMQQFLKFIKMYHLELFNLESFNLEKIIVNLDDNINKNSLIIPIEYIKAIVIAWNGYVDRINNGLIDMEFPNIFNIRKPYILTYTPAIGTKIKIPTNNVNSPVQLLYATYNRMDKWCVHKIKDDNISKMQLDENRNYLLIQLDKNSNNEMECKILKGVKDNNELIFTLPTYMGYYPSTQEGYDVAFCLFLNNVNNNLFKIDNCEILLKCLGIENDKNNSIIITSENLEYYSCFNSLIIDPSKIDYNNIEVKYPYPSNFENNTLRVFGNGYGCSKSNLLYSKIKMELEEGNSFIGNYSDVEKLLQYLGIKNRMPNTLQYHTTIQVKKNNGDYLVIPCSYNSFD